MTIDRHIVNDMNTDIMSVYKHMKNVRFVDEVNAEIVKFVNLPTVEAQKEYHLNNVLKLNAGCANDRIQALRFLMYVRVCYRSMLKQVNGKYTNRSINLRPLKGHSTTNVSFVKNLTSLLESVECMSRDFVDVINEFGDDEGNFLFCDPPYLECDTPNILYGCEFNKTHYDVLFDLFSALLLK
jgi:site-specific DNA-adenine methylase